MEHTRWHIYDLLNRPKPLWLVGIDLEGEDLRHADLSHVDLSHANLANASLKASNLRDARQCTTPWTYATKAR